jgi:pyridoxal phosphate enzyme (YggS family)
MCLEKNLLSVQEQMQLACQQSDRTADDVRLLAVTKKSSLSQIKALLDLGQRHFGENRLDHLKEMATALKDEAITWHFIGHLQRNKVQAVLRYCSWVQSVDSLRLIDKLQEVAMQSDRPVNILLQLNISDEVQKTGLKINQLNEAVAKVLQSTHLNLRGFMCMAPLSEDATASQPIFEACTEQFNRIKKQYQLKDDFDTLSMGMSNDFATAIICGATQVRIGSALYSVNI